MKPKPCPFCGVQPMVGPKDPKREGTAWGFVQCENPKCPTWHIDGGVRVMDGAECCDDRGSEAYKQLAIERWNQRRRRTPPDANPSRTHIPVPNRLAAAFIPCALRARRRLL